MDLGRLLTMVLNMALRRVMNMGLNRGMNWLARRGKAPEHMSAEEQAAAAQSRQTMRRMRQATRILRRFR